MLLSHTDFRGGANVLIPMAETTTHFVTEVCTLFSLFCMARCHRLVTEFVSLFLFTFYSLRKKNSLPLQRDHNEWTVVNNEVEVRECLLISRMCLCFENHHWIVLWAKMMMNFLVSKKNCESKTPEHTQNTSLKDIRFQTQNDPVELWHS